MKCLNHLYKLITIIKGKKNKITDRYYTDWFHNNNFAITAGTFKIINEVSMQ